MNKTVTKLKPRVFLVLKNFAGGGAERILVRLANYLHQTGRYEAIVICGSDEGPNKTNLLQSVPVLKLGAGSAFAFTRKLTSALGSRNPDVVLSTLVHVNIMTIFAVLTVRGIWYVSAIIKGPLKARADFGGSAKVRLILREANTLSVELRQFSPAKHFLLRLAVRVLYPVADKIICVSKGVKTDLQTNFSLARSKVVVIYNPPPKAQKSPMQGGYSEGRPKVVISAGRLAPQKNFKFLLRVLYLLSLRDDFYLHIFGEGSERDNLLEYAAGLGISHRLKIFEYSEAWLYHLGGAEAYVMSSLWEGMPNSVVEALFSDATTICTNTPHGPSEILGRHIPEWLVDFDEFAFADAIVKVLPSAVRMRKINAAKRDYAAQASGFEHYCAVISGTEILI